MKLSDNFHLDEFACHDGTPVPPELVPVVRLLVTSILQPIRDHFGKALYIISGYRTWQWNQKVGGAAQSTHLTAAGADFRVVGVSPEEVHKTMLSQRHNESELRILGGLGLYPGWVHADIRRVGDRLRQWSGTGVGSEQ